MEQTIRIGVVGTGRGRRFAEGVAPSLGMKLVAICDNNEEKVTRAGTELAATSYVDYDAFLSHDMDAVILANYFHEHAPFAIKALRAGKHVMSETTACFTLGEGVKLIETVEKTGLVYMFAENYPYMLFNQEMRRLYQAGKIGTFMYGEGEYVHPMSADDYNRISPGMHHWRNWIPATYYSTHSLAPIMYITDTRPVKVNGFITPYRSDDPVHARTVRINDASSMIALRMDNDATVKLLQWGLRGHGVWVRVHGSRGQMENLRHGNRDMVRLRREQWHEDRVDPEEQIYLPDFPEHHEQAMRSGHGGGDFFMNYHFANAIRTNTQPYLDVYRGVAMSAVGILAYRSALDDSATYDIPDFRNPADRKAYASDNWRPDPSSQSPDTAPCSIQGRRKPAEQGVAYAEKVWKDMGIIT